MKLSGRPVFGVALASLVMLAPGAIADREGPVENPYERIADRNAFGLRSPPAGPHPATAGASAPSNALPELVLTGIADFSARKWALLTTTERGNAPRHYTLREGSSQDGLEVLAIDGTAGRVSVRIHGTEMVLSLATQDKQRREAQAAEIRFVDEHTRAHEALQRRERERIDRERAYAAAGWDIATGQPIPSTGQTQPNSTETKPNP